MKESITQESKYGCGIACFAFATSMTYQDAVRQLGQRQANSERFWCKDLRQALHNCGLSYVTRYLNKPQLIMAAHSEAIIVLLRRSSNYPVGHYLIYHQGKWMDPWINMTRCKSVSEAKSGYRKVLPGEPMYALFPLL